MLVGWRNVTRRPGRLLTTVLAFMLAILVAIIIRGFSDGLYASQTALVRRTDADLWIQEAGGGLLSSSLRSQLEDLPGVRAVYPLWTPPVMADIAGRKVPMTLLGYDTRSGVGGPWEMAEGRAPDTAVRAVDGLSLSVATGEVVLIMGPSGSGNTTLLAIASCLMRPDAGRVHIGGLDATGLSQRQLPAIRRERVGFIFQSFNLLGALTAREYVELVVGLAGRRDQRSVADALLTTLGLERRANSLPAQLSGGEKQRVAIARALAPDPRLILADEPTANLDSRAGQQVMALLAQAAGKRQKAVVIVSHDARLREIADRILWMEDGHLSPTDS